MMLICFSSLYWAVSLIGMILVGILFKVITKGTVEDVKARHIAEAIATGAMTFLYEEYKIILFMVLVGSVVIAYVA
ncbi:MAG: hypothetical protein WBQ73_01345, partial [Candidatus Babeliales bacterium]